MKRAVLSWQTTLAGLLTLAATLVEIYAPEHARLAEAVIGFAVAAGFVAAKDARKSHTQDINK